MAWRPNGYLLEGELDNTTPGRVTGWMQFAGLNKKVTFELEGNFHRDIRGAKIRFRGDGNADDPEAASYMEGFSLKQTGNAGDMTAGGGVCRCARLGRGSPDRPNLRGTWARGLQPPRRL